MYSLQNDVVNPAYESQGGHGGLFADGVNYKRMQVGEGSELRIKLLPAHDPALARVEGDNIVVDPVSWVPFRDMDGNLTAWGRKIYLVQFVGHGPKSKGTKRRDLISLKSYGGDGETYCPIVALQDVIKREPTWQYLNKDKVGQDGKTVLDGKAISKDLSTNLIANIIDINDVGSGVQLGIFSKSACDRLIAPEKGIVWQVNLTATPEMLQQNPMLRWACGDLTHPQTGPVLAVKKDNASDNRRFAGYTLDYCTTTQGVMRYPVDDTILASRYNLLDLNTIIPKPTEEELIQKLVTLFDGFAPTGEHEYELLKYVFGSMTKIPDPPARAYSPGLGAQPMGGAIGGMANAMPQGAGATDFVQPKIGAAASQPPVPTPSMQPAAPPVPAVPQAPMPPAQPAAPPSQPAPAAATPAATPAMPATPAVPATPATPAVPTTPAAPAAPIPGDAAPAFDRQGFLAQLKENNNG